MPHRLLRNATVKVTELLQKAISDLAGMRKGLLTVDFLFLCLMEQKDSIVTKTIDELRLSGDEVRQNVSKKISHLLDDLPSIKIGEGSTASMKVSKDVQILFDNSERERAVLGDSYISTASIFLACFSREFVHLSEMFIEDNIRYDQVLEAIKRLRGNSRVTQKDGESRASLLDEYTVDMTALARKGQLDPVVGRSLEIQRLIEILSRRKKNNPILIGEPGVGKTVLLEGLAQQIVDGDVPEFLKNRKIISLEMGTLIAGAKMQGEFEERLKAIKDEVVSAAGEIIIFIDEIHTVIGTGRSGGGLDASNMLKPALAKGLLQCVGATTLKEYKTYIEADKALERRFQLIRVNEPTIDQAILILRSLQPKYQKHHQVEYTDEAIEKAVTLSAKYIEQRFLPDKAIDLLDEAGAAKRIKTIYSPPEMRQLESERTEVERQKTKAFSESNFEAMAKSQMELATIEEKLAELRKGFSRQISQSENKVTEEDIASIVFRITGIPIRKMVAAESQKLVALEEKIGDRVVGQSHAIEAISNAIRRNRSGLRKASKPIASFLFLGPTGVGKTELTKALAAEVLDDESKIIRLDMSEYMERHDVSKLIGSPPGYVGYGEGGQLTEKVKHQPYSVILLDEIEKAHPDVYNVLLPVLDEGWLTDGEGQKVSFKNCVIVGTSNLGSQFLVSNKRPVGIGSQSREFGDTGVHNDVMKEVKNFLRPEFLNRLDEVIIFNRLEKDDLKKILSIQITDLSERINQLGLVLDFSMEAKDFIINTIDNASYGARPIRRKLEVLVENKIATLLIERGGDEGGVIDVRMADGEIRVDFARSI